MSTQFAPRRTTIDVDRYERMIEAGIFRPGERVELIEGELLDMAPIGPPHQYATDTLVTLLHDAGVSACARLSVSGPLVLGPLSEPEPDLMLLALPAHRYRRAKPTAADVLLLIEVADSSLAYDRGAKLALYARFGIREVWIVDLEGRRLHVFREPDAAQAVYCDSHVLDPDDSATPEALPGLALGWGEALG